MSIKVDPELAAILAAMPPVPKPELHSALDIRRIANASITSRAVPPVEGVAETKHTISSVDGTSIDVYRFVPPVAATSSPPQRAILFAFGGGMVAGSVAIWRPMIGDIAMETGTQVFAVDYRLAPEHPGPAAVEDCYSSVAWLQSKAADFNVDPKRIVLFGKSAGGGICAGTALMAKDKGLLYPIAAVALIYPMLDDQTVLADDHPLSAHITWNSTANTLAWEALLGNTREKRTNENVPVYCAPVRAKAEDLRGLPDTYIEVGGLDLFKNECLAYASKLATADVDVEFHLYSGVPHGFEFMPGLSVAAMALANQTKFLISY
ncbi:Alpha/Beta hydrolase protein [Xylariaceae sp. FL0255]|nr:Alpha/Beta hydrolase protein [Xylariaceae sp. FL0255]